MSGYQTGYDEDLHAGSGDTVATYQLSGSSRAEGNSREQLDAEALIRRAVDLIGNAKAMPLSSSVLISREEILELLEDAVQRLPEEMRQARWLLKERDEFLGRTRREGKEIIAQAQARAAHMVERTEIVRQAQATARRTIDDASQEALRLRHEAEDFCDQKLAAFEIVLDRATKMVKSGREKLQVTPAPLDSGLGEPELSEEGYEEGEISGDTFFDQDLA